jgi:hypothetical protein
MQDGDHGRPGAAPTTEATVGSVDANAAHSTSSGPTTVPLPIGVSWRSRKAKP